jgi:zinc transport system substrate-binding protein
MKSSRFILLIILLLLGIAAIFALNKPNNTIVDNKNQSKQQKPIIITTLFPFYDITRTLIGDQADISLLLPPGIEPHSFEPTPQDIVQIQEADIFIYTGDSMEPWVKDIISNLPKTVTVINASQGITLIEDADDHGHGHADDHGHGHADDHGHGHADEKNKEKLALDPHFWLDFNNTIIATKTISDTISSKNIVDTTLLSQNRDILTRDFTQIDIDYRDTLGKCRNKTILQAGHRTFGYLAKRYNLEYITTEELSPNSDTSAQDIANLVDEIKAEKAKAVFSEELIEPRIANTISDETGVPILLLNGAHNITSDQFKSGTSFINIMRDNLENLSTGLDCK